jgi:WD40 repeat protein
LTTARAFGGHQEPMAADGLTCAVTELCFVHLPHNEKLLCAGVGPYLRVYRLRGETLLPSCAVASACATELQLFPPGTRIHGIVPDDHRHLRDDPALVVRGGRYVAIMDLLALQTAALPAVCPKSRSFDDWVLDARRIRQSEGWFSSPVIVALAHGDVNLCDASTLATLVCVSSPSPELFWCLSVRETNSGVLSASAGTSFGQIVLWTLDSTLKSLESRGSPLRLKGHDGPVMRTVFSDDNHLLWLASASVDRTVRLWKRFPADEKSDPYRPSLQYAPYAVYYGHTARTWHLALCQGGGSQCAPPRVLSVGEDRTLRLWPQAGSQHAPKWSESAKPIQNHQTPPDVFHGHSGRNVWTLACTPVYGDADKPGQFTTVATGGDDGMIQIRQICLTSRDQVCSTGENFSVGESQTSTAKSSDGADIKFPREPRIGSSDEAVQSIFLLSPSTIVVSTNYGRILVGRSNLGSEPLCLEGFQRFSWRVVFHSNGDLTFAPNALQVAQGSLIIAGATNGTAVVVHLNCSATGQSGEQPALKLQAFGFDAQLTAGIYLNENSLRTGDAKDMPVPPTESCYKSHGIGAKVPDTVDIYFASLEGALHHWQLVESAGDLSKANAQPLAIYKQEKPVRFGLITSVLAFESAGRRFIVVGDRRGFMHLYAVLQPTTSPSASSAAQVIHPVAFCRPHLDRVSSLILLSVNSVRDTKKQSGQRFHFLSVGFDGLIAETCADISPDKLADVTKCQENQATDCAMSIESTTRCGERIDTLVHVTYARSSDSMDLRNRWIVAGFRSAQLVVWDVTQRVMLMRADIGGWRRAMGLCVHVEADKEGDTVRVRDCLVAFWRSGVLRVASSKPEGLASIGSGFHGLRAHSGHVLPAFRRQEVPELLTSSEDTTLHVTRLGNGGTHGAWSTRQIMCGHSSGVNSVSASEMPSGHAEGDVLALSGGGMDEVCLWRRPSRDASWALAYVHRPALAADRSSPRHRVMCVSLYGLRRSRPCSMDTPDGMSIGIGCRHVAALALIGRSDGSVTLSSVVVHVTGQQDGHGQKRESMMLEDIQRREEHTGAVLSGAFVPRAVVSEPAAFSAGKMDADTPGHPVSGDVFEQVDADGGDDDLLAVTGDSAGRICVWAICTKTWSLSLASVVDHAHAAGVNSVCGLLLLGTGLLAVASAGDDEAVTVRVASGGTRSSAPAAAWTWGAAVFERRLHCAAAVGVALVMRPAGTLAVMSVGADQRVCTSRLVADAEGVVAVRGDRRSTMRITNVADPAGLAVLAAPADDAETVQVAVYGCGLEVFAMTV